MKKAVLAGLALACGASLAAADVVTLTNGRKIEGIYSTSPGQPGKVVVEVGAGTIVLDAKDVSSVEKGRTALHEYYDRFEKVRNSNRAADFVDLAQWARDNRLFRFVRTLSEKAIALEPNNEIARRMAGFRRVGDKWLTEEEEMIAKGMVKTPEGAWITQAEKELREKRRLEAEERARIAREKREAQKEEERRRRQEALEAHMEAMARASELPYGYLYQPNWFWPAYYRPYPWNPYKYKRPPSYGYGGYYDPYGGALPTFNIFDFVPNPFLK